MLPSVALRTGLQGVVCIADPMMTVPTLMTRSVPGLYTGTVVTSSPSVTQAATLSDAAVQ